MSEPRAPAFESEKKTCESCGKQFGCGAKLDGCWCADVIISDESATDLKAKFSDCLCPVCLAKVARGEKNLNEN